MQLARAAGVPPTNLAYRAFLAVAVAWTPCSFGGEVGANQLANEPNQSAQTTVANTLGPEAIEQANALLRAGDAESAIALLRDYAPQNVTMQSIKRLTLGGAYADVEDWKSALAQYVGVIDAPGGLPPDMVATASLGAGQSCMRLGRYEDAIPHLEAWKDAKGPEIGTHSALAQAYEEIGQYALAIENLEAGLRMAEEKARVSQLDPKVVTYFRNEIAEVRRLVADQ